MGISRLKFLGLRYSSPSILIDQGENIKYIQNKLGHAKASKTPDIYGRLMKTENSEPVGKRGNLFFWGQGSKNVISLLDEKTEIVKTLTI